MKNIFLVLALLGCGPPLVLEVDGGPQADAMVFWDSGRVPAVPALDAGPRILDASPPDMPVPRPDAGGWDSGFTVPDSGPPDAGPRFMPGCAAVDASEPADDTRLTGVLYPGVHVAAETYDSAVEPVMGPVVRWHSATDVDWVRSRLRRSSSAAVRVRVSGRPGARVTLWYECTSFVGRTTGTNCITHGNGSGCDRYTTATGIETAELTVRCVNPAEPAVVYTRFEYTPAAAWCANRYRLQLWPEPTF